MSFSHVTYLSVWVCRYTARSRAAKSQSMRFLPNLAGVMKTQGWMKSKTRWAISRSICQRPHPSQRTRCRSRPLTPRPRPKHLVRNPRTLCTLGGHCRSGSRRPAPPWSLSACLRRSWRMPPTLTLLVDILNIRVYIYIYIYIYIHRYIYIYVYIYTYIYIYVSYMCHICTSLLPDQITGELYIHVNACIHAYIHGASHQRRWGLYVPRYY